MFKLIQTSIQDLMSIYYVWGPEVKSYCEKVRRNFCKHKLKPPRSFEQRNQGHRKVQNCQIQSKPGYWGINEGRRASLGRESACKCYVPWNSSTHLEKTKNLSPWSVWEDINQIGTRAWARWRSFKATRE